MERLIRYWRNELAFVALTAFALWCGAGAAWQGVPRFVAALTPGMEAQADVTPPTPLQDHARLSLPGFAQSHYAPQVLYPIQANAFPAWMKQTPAATPPPMPASAPVIAICIDDLGEDYAGTSAAIRLPAAVALSFLPFAPSTPSFAAEAQAHGHVVLAHVPMQAISAINPGPMALEAGMDRDEIVRRLTWALGQVPGAVGINNHEGSRFTADAASLTPVMQVLKARGLFFLDSRTSAASRGEAVAQAADVFTGARDVFLDDDQSPAAIRHQLDVLVAMARAHGAAIAIGHPHAATLAVLKDWFARDNGVKLVTLTEAMRVKAAHEPALARR